jgi:hypothetical protein
VLNLVVVAIKSILLWQEFLVVLFFPIHFQIAPRSGPSKGGTRLTIRGENLGKFEDTITVDIDGVPCIVQEFVAPRK